MSVDMEMKVWVSVDTELKVWVSVDTGNSISYHRLLSHSMSEVELPQLCVCKNR